jgi:VIT1/CCC1 family predicted Fe2+/Mn2+ transporter
MSKVELHRRTSERHARPTLLSNFILGGQDGLVNVLGVILGVSAATNDIRIIFVAAFAALGAEAISMGAVAYTSTLARRMHYLKEEQRERFEMRDTPETERKEVEDIFKRWGYSGKELRVMTDNICSNKKAWLEFMMAHELNLSPVGKSDARDSFVVVLSSTVFGSVLPILPFLYFTSNILYGVESSIAISAIALFIIGAYEAKSTVGSIWRRGLQMLVIGMVAGFAGYLIGRFFGAVPA